MGSWVLKLYSSCGRKRVFHPLVLGAAIADWSVVGAGVTRGPALAASFTATADLELWGI